ncbi:MAG: hypothetical protein ACRDJE_04110 [Dehalococcoidia bacterium]
MVREDAALSKDGGGDTVPVGEIAIDPVTGEVIGWSAEYAGNQLSYLVRVCVEAQQAIKQHEAVHQAARAAIERLLTESGRQSVKTPYGTPSMQTQMRRVGRPERVAEVVQRHELSQRQEQLIWMCAGTLDAKELESLTEAGVLPAEVVEEIVEVKTTSFVRVRAPRQAAP